MSIGGYRGHKSGASVGPGAELLVAPHAESQPTQWYRERIPRRRRSGGAGGLPNHRPFTHHELLQAGVTRAGLRDNFLRIEQGMYVHRDHLCAERTSTGSGLGRRVPPATLVRAHGLACPGHIATGFGAAALYGMTYFAEDEQLEFFVPRGAECSNPAVHLALTRTRRLDVVRARSFAPDPVVPLLRCTDPGLALARMLRTLDRRDAARDERWRVPDLSGIRSILRPEFIRQVQVSDAFHQALRKTEPGSLEALVEVRAMGVGVEVSAAVLGMTDVGAESPQETLLRLIVADLAPGLRSQIPVYRDSGVLLTAADLGWEEHGVYLFYDGGHHLRREQRDHDSEVLAVLQRKGGRVFRVTAGQVQDAGSVVMLRERVAEALNA